MSQYLLLSTDKGKMMLPDISNKQNFYTMQGYCQDFGGNTNLMNRKGITWLTIPLAALSIFSESVANTENSTVLNGYVIDKQCAESVRQDSDPTTFIRHHTKDCSLMPNCRAIGYSIYAGGSWFDLDNKGNAIAIKLLQVSKKKSDFFVQAQGKLQGKTLKVESMKEIDKPQRPASTQGNSN